MMFNEVKVKYLIAELLRLDSRRWTEYCCDSCPLNDEGCKPTSEGKCMNRVLEFLKTEDDSYIDYDYPEEEE